MTGKRSSHRKKSKKKKRQYWYISLVKLRLSPPVIAQDIEYPLGWSEMWNFVKKWLSKQKGVVFAGILGGGEWDLAVVTKWDSVEDMEDFVDNFAKLGIVEKSHSYMVGWKGDVLVNKNGLKDVL